MLRVHASSLSGTIRAPPSKSETHRELVVSALASGVSRIRNVLDAVDTQATLAGICALGAEVTREGQVLCIAGGCLHAAESVIDCGNSGTTLRLLTAVAARLEGTTRFTGDRSLMRRPMQPLLSALEQLGARVAVTPDGIAVTGPIQPGTVAVRGDISSQFVSALLIAGCSVTLASPLVSAPYADMTCASLVRRGVGCTRTGTGYVTDGACPQAAEVTIEGDWSSAAYLLAAGAVAGRVTVTGLNPASVQGDRRILAILSSFGAGIVQADDTVTVTAGPLAAGEFNLCDTPDLVPAVAVLAAHASGTTRIYGVAHLMYKESDRLSVLTDMLSRMGISAVLEQDGCRIAGGRLQGACVSAADDHRIGMAAVVAGLCAAGEVSVADTAFAVSYPAFLSDIRRLGGNLEL